jgi:hypothetical protein
MATATCAASAQIFRCSTPSGAMAYQQFPCDPNNDAGTVQIQSFPEIDREARDRLMQREAALDQRLEAQRERLSREEMTRVTARAQVAAAQAAAAPADVPYYGPWPTVLTRTPFGIRHAPNRMMLR